MATPPQGPAPVPPKKMSPIVWIIGGIFGLILLAGIVMIAGGLFVANKIHNAVSNPALAAAKLIAAANPDVEILSSDERAGTVTFKDKKDGKVITLNFDQIKQGKLTFEQDGKKVTMAASGDGVKIAGDDGSTVQIGAGASSKLPDWLPSYPGATTQGSFAMQGSAESAATVSFTTKDSIDQVAKFYQDAFKKAGFSTSANMMQQDGKTSGGMISAESEDKKKSAVVNIAAGEDAATVGITYSDKK
jgi:hypothetical protein